MPTITEQITAFEAKRGANAARMKSIMDEAAEQGATLDQAEQEEFDGLAADNGAIDDHLKRLRAVEKMDAQTAVPAVGASATEGGESRGGERIIVKSQPKLEPGIEFARLVKSLGAAKGDMGRAVRLAEARYGPESNAVGALKRLFERGSDRLEYLAGHVEKANVVAGSTLSGTWAADMVLDEGGAFADFANYLRPATILGKFGQNGVPPLRRVPFRTALGISTSGGTGYWVGEGKPKPLTSFNVNKTFLEPLKCANICVLTEELLLSSATSAEALVRDELRNALVELIDESFIDPSNAGTANVEPASITNGADAIAASGTGDADDIRLDIRSLIQKFLNNNQENSEIVLIMRAGDAMAASFLVNALGQPEFPNIAMGGGTLAGLSVITSQKVPSGNVIAVQPSEVYFADEDGFMVDVSREASLQMLDNPTNDSVTPTPTTLVSLWQTNSVGFRVERILNWSLRRSTAVTYLTGVAWGGAVST